jgi:DNA-directed RNA polymerase subunit delta
LVGHANRLYKQKRFFVFIIIVANPNHPGLFWDNILEATTEMMAFQGQNIKAILYFLKTQDADYFVVAPKKKGVAVMHDIKARAAYLRGLITGTEIAGDEKQKLVWESVADFCDEVAETVTDLQSSYDEFGEYIEAIDEDLSMVEKYFYQNETADDQEVLFSRSAGDDEAMIAITCPNCREELNFQDSDQDYEVVCPECGKVVWTHCVTQTAADDGDHSQAQIDLN